MTVRELRGLTKQKSIIDKLIDGDPLTAPSEPLNLRDYLELLLLGGFPFPALALKDPVARAAWFDSYVDDLLSHDIEQIEEPTTRKRDPARLRRYFEAYAVNSGGVCDHKTIYDAAGLNKKTASAYEDLFEKLFVVESVEPWMTNRLSRLTHQPKRYVVDPALACHLLRLDARGILRDGDLTGRLLDTFVMTQLRPEITLSSERVRCYHLRTEGGRQEIDVVLELGGGRVIGIEVKANAAPDADDAKHLVWLRDQLGDRFHAGVVLSSTPRVYGLSDKIVAAPISAIWAA
jgi:predicted AAA+ superfamily ATPase